MCHAGQLSDNWKEKMGFGRWLSNEKVSIDWLLAQIQGDRKLEGFGFLIHPNLLLDAGDGRCLGLGELTVFDQWLSPGDREALKQSETTTEKTRRWLPLFIWVNVVDLQEILPKGATYQPLHWRIYTSHPIKNNDQARQIIQWYCWRMERL